MHQDTLRQEKRVSASTYKRETKPKKQKEVPQHKMFIMKPKRNKTKK